MKEKVRLRIRARTEKYAIFIGFGILFAALAAACLIVGFCVLIYVAYGAIPLGAVAVTFFAQRLADAIVYPYYLILSEDVIRSTNIFGKVKFMYKWSELKGIELRSFDVNSSMFFFAMPV